jgi:hypothetical protein
MENSKKISLGLLTLTSCFALSSHAAIVINEIDYDQPGADTAEFIELFNSGNSITSLDNYSINLINGFNSSVYENIDLSGFSINANSYFVVCSNASLVANCNYIFKSSNSWFQNGTPDADEVALYNRTDLLDSLSYGGLLSPYTEGDALTIKDNRTDILSLSRLTDGVDSNNNLLDFELGCITPGSANVAGSGDCSVVTVSAVPVPAAVWLFGSGMLGLLGFARRK